MIVLSACMGLVPAAAEDEPPAPNSIREPRTQVGLRITPHDKVDVDVI